MTHMAFLGTGLLGSGMVESMLRRGLRSPCGTAPHRKRRPWNRHGAAVADTPEQAVAAADEIHMTLSDDAAVDAVLERIAPHVKPSATDHRSHDHVAGRHADATPACGRARLRFLHAPVSWDRRWRASQRA